MVKLLALATAALCVADVAVAIPTFPIPGFPKLPRPGPKPRGLVKAARSKGKYIGTAVDNPYLEDTQYRDLVWNTKEFNQITPENPQKWFETEPEQGVFNFTLADQLVNRALRNGQFLRCHALVWHSQLAPWVEETQWTNETLIDAMVNHVTQVAKHFRGRCAHWDVLNEALNDDGTWRDTVFYRVIGPEYVPIAFAAAAKADPFAKLYYNDYNMERIDAKTEAAVRLVEFVRSRGVKIDGMGMQAHRTLGGTPSYEEQMAVIDMYTRAGVESAYTEVDIRMEVPADPEKLAQQKKEYYDTVRACVDSRRCVGVTVWGPSDRYSWIPDWFEGEGDALPWDADYNKKPAYYGILEAFTDKRRRRQ